MTDKNAKKKKIIVFGWRGLSHSARCLARRKHSRYEYLCFVAVNSNAAVFFFQYLYILLIVFKHLKTNDTTNYVTSFLNYYRNSAFVGENAPSTLSNFPTSINGRRAALWRKPADNGNVFASLCVSAARPYLLVRSFRGVIVERCNCSRYGMLAVVNLVIGCWSSFVSSHRHNTVWMSIAFGRNRNLCWRRSFGPFPPT